MQKEKNILVNRGIPRTPSSPFGFGVSAGVAPKTDNWDGGYDAVDYALELRWEAVLLFQEFGRTQPQKVKGHLFRRRLRIN